MLWYGRRARLELGVCQVAVVAVATAAVGSSATVLSIRAGRRELWLLLLRAKVDSEVRWKGSAVDDRENNSAEALVGRCPRCGEGIREWRPASLLGCWQLGGWAEFKPRDSWVSRKSNRAGS